MIWLLRNTARAVAGVIAAVQAVVIGSILLALLAVVKDFFDADYYRTTYRKRLVRRLFPMLEFAFFGARALKDPNSWFSQRNYILERSRAGSGPPILDFLLYGRYRLASKSNLSLAEPNGDPVETISIATELGVASGPGSRVEHLWPLIRSDLMGLRDVAHQLSPTESLKRKLVQHTTSTRPPQVGSVIRALLDQFPSNASHLVLVPWLGVSGGAERIGQRLIRLLREHYKPGELCVFAPDGIFDLSPAEREIHGVPIIAINDVDPAADQVSRIEILDRILIELRPRTVHSNNSMTGWIAFSERGSYYARDTNLFGNVYSDIRIPDGSPVGYFWQFLPKAIDCLTGVMTDNQNVINRASEHFGFLPSQMARHHLVPTPVLGLDGKRAGSELRPFRDPGAKRSLWMSRIAIEKRLDVLQAIAERCPDRNFSIYGATLQNAFPIDLSWVGSALNVRFQGEFSSFADLPIDQFDSYVFTTLGEGMPIAVLEAAMLGLPIVAPDVGGIGEFIDESTGWLVSGPDAVDEYVEALEEIHHNPVEAARRVGAAQARLLERHSWDNFRRTIAAIPGYLH